MKKKMIPDNYIIVNDIKTIQSNLYNLLDAFQKICDSNGLYYCLFGGSCLGAVRHGGFIPWDDDVDVCMPRSDYEKFCKIMDSCIDTDHSFAYYPQKNYPYYYGKFLLNDSLLIEDIQNKYAMSKLYIDIFPVDGYPDKNNEKRFFKRISFLTKMACDSVQKITVSPVWWKKPYVIIRVLKRLYFTIFNSGYFLKKLNKEITKYKIDDCEYVALNGAGWNQKGKFLKESFFKRIRVNFGPIKSYVFEDYHTNLSMFYGNYNELPPIDRRVSNHSYKLYIKNIK